MSSGVPINPARRTKTYAAAALQDPDGIRTSFATVASPVVVLPATFNGAAVTAGSGVLDLPRTVTITRSNNANQFSVDPIVITGMRGATQVTETWTPATDDGNDVFRGTQMFDTITSIALPAQGGTGGTFTIGVQDIGAPVGSRFAVRLHVAGTLNVAYEETGAITDALAATTVLEPIAACRILTSTLLSPATTEALTVYIA